MFYHYQRVAATAALYMSLAVRAMNDNNYCFFLENLIFKNQLLKKTAASLFAFGIMNCLGYY